MEKLLRHTMNVQSCLRHIIINENSDFLNINIKCTSTVLHTSIIQLNKNRKPTDIHVRCCVITINDIILSINCCSRNDELLNKEHGL